MRLEQLELRRIRLPLVRPFRTSFGTQHERDVLLLQVTTATGTHGWGECVAGSRPWYSSEYTDGAASVIRDVMAPLLAHHESVGADDVAQILVRVRGHRMAKAVVEMAVLDAELREARRSFADYLGVTRSEVPVGVSVGIADSLPALLGEVAQYVDQGYRRLKLKIEPGWDVAAVSVVRSAHPELGPQRRRQRFLHPP